MSRRNTVGNAVRGPTSALTEFLREQGINSRPQNPYTLNNNANNTADNAAASGSASPAAGPSTAATPGQSASASASPGPSKPRRRRAVAEPDSDDLDGDDDDGPSRQPAKKAKKQMTVKELEAEKERQRRAHEVKKKGQAAAGDDDDWEENEEEDPYTAPAKKGKSTAAGGPGSRTECAECGKKVIITQYTPAALDGDGVLCPACAKAGGIDQLKKLAPKKRAPKAKQRAAPKPDDHIKVPSLQEVCIKLIGDHIEDVEELGEIGLINMDRICRIIAKNRSLTSATAQLFFDISRKKLKLYDSSNLDAAALGAIASFCPHLEELSIDLCGRAESSTMVAWGERFDALRRIELYGPFLVRVPGWKKFLEAMGERLEGFLITQSPRFDLECTEHLVKHCPNLTELRLADIRELTPECLTALHGYTSLTLLDLSRPGQPMTPESVIALLSSVGAHLLSLNLSNIPDLTDDVLVSGIRPHCHDLASLDISDCVNVDPPGIVGLFGDWKTNVGLRELNLKKCYGLDDDALRAVLAHSGRTLEKLSVNALKELGKEALDEIGRAAPRLRELDAGWCREVDDYTMKDWLEGCTELEQVKVWGCNRLTANCPRKRGVRLIGCEALTV